MSSLTDAIKENISIIDYLNSNSISYKKAGRYYQLIDMDSLMIKPNGKNFTRYSTGEYGTVIDFVMLYEKLSEKEAITKLRYMLPNIYQTTQSDYAKKNFSRAKAVEEKKEEMVLPQRHKGKYTRLFAYLTKSRNISPNVVEDMVKRNLVYEDDKHHNAVWVGYDYDDKPKFACKRVTVDKEHLPKYSMKTENELKTGVFLSKDKMHLFIVNSQLKEKVIAGVLEKNPITQINIVLNEEEKKNNILQFINSMQLKAEVATLTEVELPKERYLIQEPFTRGDVLGSSKEVGWFVNNNSNSLLVCEAPIDAMSLMSLLEYHNVQPTRHSYLAQGGVCLNSLEYHIKRNPKIDTVYLCYDNDSAGHKARSDSRELLKSLGFEGRIIDKPPHSKDWNEDLQGLNITFKKREKETVIEQINMFKNKKEIPQWRY